MDIPSKIDRYEVLRLLGSGSMGKVYLGRDPSLDRMVAIKILRTTDLDEQTRKQFAIRFQNEARAAAKLVHPNIVQIHDVGNDPTVGPYIVLEYVDGMSLKTLIRNEGALAPDMLVKLADQIADALTLAHTHGILHRDIKPDNLLVTSAGNFKLADFGIARLPDSALTIEGQFLGTPSYSAPETLRDASYSVLSDIYSFAAVLYEAVSGRRAFDGMDARAIAAKVFRDIPPPPSDVAPDAGMPKDADRAILKGLDKDPQSRPHSALALCASVRKAYASFLCTPDACFQVVRFVNENVVVVGS
ncbi:MAG: serine/threonine-protein kinase [Polyangiales bacterium]